MLACFDGLFVHGLECETSDDCGPSLACVDGRCGGYGQSPVCGNWLLEDGEQCDDGNTVDTDACTSACQHAVCGDGIVGPNEECDDGNIADDPLCDHACRVPPPPGMCGDGLPNLGEQCDDGNAIDTDACTSECKLQVCGDEYVGPGEQCDDGNDIDTDACLSNCLLATCGDGVVGPFESCDDGNDDDGDDCTSMCLPPTCSDAQQDGGETDIDCGGPCGPCEIGSSCTVAADCVGAHCEDGVCHEIALALAAGDSHTCARLNTGVRCWGESVVGQLGYGNVDYIGDNEAPRDAGLVELGGEVEQLAAGAAHSCAILQGGGLRCWGNGANGRLGLGNTENIGDDEPPIGDERMPIDTVSVGRPVVGVVLGGTHSCAWLDGGQLRCFGRSNYGQLGYGDTSDIGDDELPIDVGLVELGGAVVQLSAGQNHTCALLDGGELRCFGRNHVGQLGQGHTAAIGDNELPDSVAAVNVGASVTQLGAGRNHVCVLLDGGSVRCWGENDFGQLGYGHLDTIGDEPGEMPPADVPLGGTVVQLAAAAQHNCALLDDGSVRCWGRNQLGQLGLAHTDDLGDEPGEMPPPLVELGGFVTQIAAGEAHTCVVLAGGSVRCWGRNAAGELGYGHLQLIGDDETPAEADNVPCLW